MKIKIIPAMVSLMLLMLIYVALLSSCSKPAKNEKEIIADLQENPALFSYGGELTITGCDITKRRTDPENYSDVIYLDVFASNDDIECTLSYIMNYELYNDGWVLESVEQDYDGQWSIVPLHGMTDEDIQAELDYYVDMGLYDNVTLINRDTELSDSGCAENVTLQATKDHFYGTETFELTQTWYFDSAYCVFTSVVADPTVISRSLTLKDTIIGNSWQCNRNHSKQFDVWPDKFTIIAENLNEEDGNTWVDFYIQRDRNTYWDIGSNEPVSRAVKHTVSLDGIKYCEQENKWAINLESAGEYLYSSDDGELFTESSWFCFGLDENSEGYIVETSEIE